MNLFPVPKWSRLLAAWLLLYNWCKSAASNAWLTTGFGIFAAAFIGQVDGRAKRLTFGLFGLLVLQGMLVHVGQWFGLSMIGPLLLQEGSDELRKDVIPIKDLVDYPEEEFTEEKEADLRRSVMRELAKIGFTQSYTYFTWKNYRWELVEYLNELDQQGTLDQLKAQIAYCNTASAANDVTCQAIRTFASYAGISEATRSAQPMVSAASEASIICSRAWRF